MSVGTHRVAHVVQAAIATVPERIVAALAVRAEWTAVAVAAARRTPWADLMKRVFAVDVLDCPRCPTPMLVVAVIDRPTVIEAVLAAMQLSAEPPERAPARDPPGGGDDLDPIHSDWPDPVDEAA